jgi:NADH:ubiquinone oxidoreductase subunit F (NADH-binding)
MAYPYRDDRETTTILSRHMGEPEARTLSGWLERGGYEALRKAVQMEPDEITDVVKESGLRGRGGAGFPTGMKWSFMPGEPSGPHYLCANADESEPGAFKDREIMRWTPHLLIEGCLIAARAIRAQHVYIYVRGEFFPVIRILNQAVVEAYEAGYLGENVCESGWDCDLTVHIGAGAYIAGEETGLMSSLMGGRAEPWMKPPFPAQRGVFGAPTTVNNVETLASVPGIVMNGPAWYRGWGSDKSPGTKLWCCSGNLTKPGNYELELGGGSAGRLLDRLPDGRRAGLRDDVRGLAGGGKRPRHRLADRARRNRRDRSRHAPDRAVLRPRVLRAVRSVPRGNGMDHQDPAPNRRGGRRAEGPGHTLRWTRSTICAISSPDGRSACWPTASFFRCVPRWTSFATSTRRSCIVALPWPRKVSSRGLGSELTEG